MSTRLTRRILIALSATWLAAAPVARAEIASGDLPDMGNLAAMIGNSTDDDVDASIQDADGKISAGLPASDSARGKTATWMAEQLIGEDDTRAASLAAGFNEARDEFESELASAGFDTGDIGVGVAACFIMLWELASNDELPVAGALAAGKRLVLAFGDVEPTYASYSDEERAEALDLLVATPVAYTSLVKAFERDGRQEDADTLRTQAATLFEGFFKGPHTVFAFSDDGELTLDEQAARHWQRNNGISSDW